MSDPVQIVLIQSLAVAIPAVVAAIFSYLGLMQSRKNHSQMNSRLDEMLRMKGAAGEAVGEERERRRVQNGEKK